MRGLYGASVPLNPLCGAKNMTGALLSISAQSDRRSFELVLKKSVLNAESAK